MTRWPLVAAACAAFFSIALSELPASAQGPAPPSTAANDAAPPRPAEPENAERNTGGRVLGSVRLGAFGGVGFPRPLSVEGLVTYGDRVGVGLEYSVLPGLTVSGVHANLDAIAVDLRVFPLRNALFASLAIGHQRFNATTTVALPMGLGSLPEEVTGDTWYVNPRVGFMWTWSFGLSLGMDAGVQVPVASSFTSTIPSQLAASQTATDWSHVVGKDVLPTLTLLRLGYVL